MKKAVKTTTAKSVTKNKLPAKKPVKQKQVNQTAKRVKKIKPINNQTKEEIEQEIAKLLISSLGWMIKAGDETRFTLTKFKEDRIGNETYLEWMDRNNPENLFKKASVSILLKNQNKFVSSKTPKKKKASK